MAWDEGERAALVALLRARPSKLTWADIADLVLETGSARSMWDKARSAAPTLFDDPDDDPLQRAARDIESWQRDGVRMLTFVDHDYPAQLREIQEMPPVLFVRGTLAAAERAVSVVGSRTAPPDAIDFASKIALALVESGIGVASGLAAGIDTAAHTATLAVHGRAVAVIGTGIRRCYPRDNERLQERIAREGLLISQFWPDAPPQKHTFLMRNAVMSGYGRATIVVAAGETSGSRAQARMAVDHGRPVLLTDRVVSATDWGRRLVGRPGVHVVTSVPEALATVEKVTRRLPDQLDVLLPTAG
jgi:DNA processing protein